MTKAELSALIHEACTHVGEGEAYFADSDRIFPRTAYWDFAWRDDVASGEGHTTIVTYQISHAATQPRDKELIALKHALNARGLHPDITREYVKGTTSPGSWHSAMAVEVVEDI